MNQEEPNYVLRLNKARALELLTGGEEGVLEWNEFVKQGGQLPNLSGVNLKGARLDNAILKGVCFAGAVLTDASLCQTTIYECDFSDASLEKTNFSKSTLSFSNFERAVLHHASLRETKISNCLFLKAKITYATFEHAKVDCCNFDDATLVKGNLTDVSLVDTTFRNAKLALSIFRHAKATQVNFYAAGLLSSDLSQSEFTSVGFVGADLTDANFANSYLSGELRHAQLRSADLSNAHIQYLGVRRLPFFLFAYVFRRKEFALSYASILQCLYHHRQLPFILDSTRTVGTRFHHYVGDPWSVLRRKYTGTSFVFNLLFLCLFVLPFVVKAVGWTAANRVEHMFVHTSISKLNTAARQLADSPDKRARLWSQRVAQHTNSWPDRDAYDFARSHQETLDRLQVLLVDGTKLHGSVDVRVNQWSIESGLYVDGIRSLQQMEMKSFTVAELLLGVDKGWKFVVLITLMLAYNAGRGWLTHQVGPLREQEERSGDSPAWSDYRNLYRCHRYVVTPLFFLAVIAFFVNAKTWLTYPVLLPF